MRHGQNSDEDIEEFLADHGFSESKDPIDAKGRIVALHGLKGAYDVLFCPVKDLSEKGLWYDVIQENTRDFVVFGDLTDIGLVCKVAGGMELYLHKYMDYFIGDTIPKGLHDRLTRWDLLQKVYVPEVEIAGEHPELYKAILGKIERERCPDDSLRLVRHRLSTQHCTDAGFVPVVDDKVIRLDVRTKDVEGVYSSLKRQPNRSLDDIIDINGVRVIAKDIADCYHLAGRILRDREIKPWRDYIASPKPNGFQAILLRHQDKPLSLEIQIMTEKMLERAEHGSASDYRRRDY